MLKQRSSSHILRSILGGYVTYLGGSIIYDFFAGEEVTTAQLLCAFPLALVGLVIVAVGLYAVLNGYSVEYNGSKPWETPEDAPENVPEPEEKMISESSENIQE